jgi:hypothetical protein
LDPQRRASRAHNGRCGGQQDDTDLAGEQPQIARVVINFNNSSLSARAITALFAGLKDRKEYVFERMGHRRELVGRDPLARCYLTDGSSGHAPDHELVAVDPFSNARGLVSHEAAKVESDHLVCELRNLPKLVNREEASPTEAGI